MSYTPKEISTIADKFKELVGDNHIQILRMDPYGKPEPYYLPKAKRELIAAVVACSGFSWSCNMQNSMACAVGEHIDLIKDAYEGAEELDMLYDLWRVAKVKFHQVALDELREIFYKGEIAEMLKAHPTYRHWTKIYERETGNAIVETETTKHLDDAERCRDMRLAS